MSDTSKLPMLVVWKSSDALRKDMVGRKDVQEGKKRRMGERRRKKKGRREMKEENRR